HEREQAERKAEPVVPVKTASGSDRGLQTSNAEKSKKLSFKEMREFEAVEQRIAETEKRLPEIEKELTGAASDAGRVHELFIEQQSLNTQLEADLERWAELADRVE
ncbi:MAG TPA: ABC transporter C-terminal domain-containing protein, partial [Pyrinomonadaceae bacterium]|nr:ABC transporter C-terminal domain-containing protein [Pyrinomonadaceae bacterium]